MEIEKNDMVMVYDGGGTVPHCKYTGRFGDLTAYWQEIVSDAVYLFRLGESEECDWLVLLGQPWSPYSPDGIRKEMCGAGALVLSPRACSFRW